MSCPECEMLKELLGIATTLSKTLTEENQKLSDAFSEYSAILENLRITHNLLMNFDCEK